MDQAEDREDDGTPEALLRFGLAALVLFAAGGVALEALHGFKVSWYLRVEAEGRRELLVLGHAHGTLLALIVLVVTGLWPRLSRVAAARRRFAAASLRGATLLLPAGFLLGGVGAKGGDPGYGILLVPLGAVLLVAGLLALWPPRRR